MLTVQFYLLLKWIGWHIVRRPGLKDRWGFNLGEDLHDWASMRLFAYLCRLEKTAHFHPIERTTGPRSWITLPNSNTTTTGTSTTVTWTQQGH